MTVKQTKEKDFGRRSGLKVHPVSIGAMRLPEEEKAIPLIRQAIDAGMTYIDTCRCYGDSELKLAKALKDGYREKVMLSTKYSTWLVKAEPSDDSSADCTYKRILDSIERLGVEYLDFYQIWNIDSPEHYELVIEKGGMLDGIVRAMDEGLVRHTGFTSHDNAENISRYIDEADWCEVILFTYNMLNPAYKEVITKAHGNGIGTIVMNPAGGGVFNEDSKVIRQAVKDSVGIDNIIEAGHRYLSADGNVDTVLCGINKPSDITSTIENFQKAAFTKEEVRRLEEGMAKISKQAMVMCTDCKYCLPCPVGINIPVMMNVVYFDRFLQVPKRAENHYQWQISEENQDRSAKPSQCVECGRCEQRCTQKIKIIKEMKYLSEKFEAKKADGE